MSARADMPADWTQETYRLTQETLFLSISILARTIRHRCIPRAQLQLVAVVAVMLAAKVTEVRCVAALRACPRLPFGRARGAVHVC